MSNMGDDYDRVLSSERDYIASLYSTLDAAREDASEQLQGTLAEVATEPEERWHREVSAKTSAARLGSMRSADNGLCFGRIDDSDQRRWYIGRIGLLDRDGDNEPLLVDWRAPAARSFYTATTAKPENIVLRRHFRNRFRQVLGFHDDVLDEESATAGSDTALVAVLNAPRTPVMRDIIATIQAEQDEIIRDPHNGIVVVDGGPGTGKTAVALHRVAYLLYERRERLARSGVLLIGPNARFLDYIGNVLPSLGETDVVFSTPGELMPGVRPYGTDTPEVTQVKGSLRMVQVLTAAVAARQELPGAAIPFVLSDVVLSVDRTVVEPARTRARATGLPHNRARAVFREWLIDGLLDRAVREIGSGWLSNDDTEIRDDLADDVRVEVLGGTQIEQLVQRLWPYLTPQQLLADLYCAPTRIAEAAAMLDQPSRDLLYRADGSAWTVSDAPLLDEAAEILGVDNSAAQQQEARERRAETEYARGVLQIMDHGDEDDDGEELRAVDVVDAEALAQRHTERDWRSLAERAAADREWIYGHIVVDEAQELSPMDWRVLMRRCPSKSMTVVGDLAQRQSSAGARRWSDVFDDYVAQRWTHRRITVNYRTPAEIMDTAGRLLRESDPDASVPTSVRSTGVWPKAWWTAEERISCTVAKVLRDYWPSAGSVAVIGSEVVPVEVDAPVFDPRSTKGLEFDLVVLVEPGRILRGDAGTAELYVAATRATQQLHVVHSEPLPSVWDGVVEQVSHVSTASRR